MCFRLVQVDDASEIKKIYALAIDAVRSIINLLGSETDMDDLYNLLETKLPVDIGMWAKLPTITTLKVSLFDLLRNRELPTLTDLYYTYRYFKRSYSFDVQFRSFFLFFCHIYIYCVFFMFFITFSCFPEN